MDRNFFEKELKQELKTLSEQKLEFLKLLENSIQIMREKDLKIFQVKVPKRDNIPSDPKDIILYYHRETFHTLEGSSKTIKRDWLNQPKPFKRFIPSKYLQLPTDFNEEETLNYSLLFNFNENSKDINFRTISEFLFYSCSISAIKYNYFKRVNASSGGLQPT